MMMNQQLNSLMKMTGMMQSNNSTVSTQFRSLNEPTLINNKFNIFDGSPLHRSNEAAPQINDVTTGIIVRVVVKQ